MQCIVLWGELGTLNCPWVYKWVGVLFVFSDMLLCDDLVTPPGCDPALGQWQLREAPANPRDPGFQEKAGIADGWMFCKSISLFQGSRCDDVSLPFGKSSHHQVFVWMATVLCQRNRFFTVQRIMDSVNTLYAWYLLTFSTQWGKKILTSTQTFFCHSTEYLNSVFGFTQKKSQHSEITVR